MKKEFWDLTLQGLINSIAIVGGFIITIIAVLKYRKELLEKADEQKKLIKEESERRIDEARKDEAARRQSELEAEGKKDAMMLQSYSALMARVKEAETFAAGLMESEAKLREQYRQDVDKERSEKHDLRNELQAEKLSREKDKSDFERERATIKIAHERELGEIKLAYEKQGKETSSDCEERIKQLTKQIEELTKKIT